MATSMDDVFLLGGITEEIHHSSAFVILSPGENLDPPWRIGNEAYLAALLRWKHCFGEVLGRHTWFVVVWMVGLQWCVESVMARLPEDDRCAAVVAAEAHLTCRERRTSIVRPPLGIRAAHVRLSSDMSSFSKAVEVEEHACGKHARCGCPSMFLQRSRSRWVASAMGDVR